MDEKKDWELYPVLVFDNFVLTPMIPQPVKIENEEQRLYLEKCQKQNSEFFIATSFGDTENPSDKDIREYGMVCIVDRVLEMPGAPTLAFVRPQARALFKGFVFSPGMRMAKVSILPQIKVPKKLSLENNMAMDKLEALFKNIMTYVPEPEKTTAEKLILDNSASPLLYLYSLSHVAPITWEDKYQILEQNKFLDLLYALIRIFDLAEQRISLQEVIHRKTHEELSQQQKENFLRVHLRQIRQELGENDETEDISLLKNKAGKKIWPDAALKHFEKELHKLKRLNINNPDYSVQFSYLENFLELPWENFQKTDLSLDKVQEILDRDHFGLSKVKERILEYMAVVKLRDDLKAPILCLYGPPGVGKTSIGKSIAEAIGREYARIALGGMHDEAEIRGHRKTYIGAMPGRFLQALSKLEYGNPLILLDEIDKVGKDFKGDPSSALLEALDPEQNNTFHDNFIDFPYDLSRVLFIATANDLTTIPAPLKDRMEIIEMPGYTTEEKREIALRHLIDKALVDNGLNEKEIIFSPEAINTIIKGYTKEKGVRQLAKAINRIIRKLALLKVKGEKLPKKISSDLVKEYLDKADFQKTTVGFKL